ncbi:hypothetical protein, partial [Escherichia coli]|uniref:hypothetical protein n=1 Tax=Escherichia coli TaxID=562 RepID=UPI001BAE6B71
MENRWTSGNKNHRGVDEDDRIRKTFIASFESYAGTIRDAKLRFWTKAKRKPKHIQRDCRRVLTTLTSLRPKKEKKNRDYMYKKKK